MSDFRFGARLLMKSPMTTAAAILSLALGIGGTTAMFSAVDAVLLRPLPYANPERLVLVSATAPMVRGASATRRGGDLSSGDYLDYRATTSFEGMIGDGARLTCVGLLLGAASAFAATRLLTTLLFGTTPTDPQVFGGTAVVLSAAALAAFYLPARRAARIDPATVLRTE